LCNFQIDKYGINISSHEYFIKQVVVELFVVRISFVGLLVLRTKVEGLFVMLFKIVGLFILRTKVVWTIRFAD
jgi:hypothetical protein